jgi:hypothetical protein
MNKHGLIFITLDFLPPGRLGDLPRLRLRLSGDADDGVEVHLGLGVAVEPQRSARPKFTQASDGPKLYPAAPSRGWMSSHFMSFSATIWL